MLRCPTQPYVLSLVPHTAPVPSQPCALCWEPQPSPCIALVPHPTLYAVPSAIPPTQMLSYCLTQPYVLCCEPHLASNATSGTIPSAEQCAVCFAEQAATPCFAHYTVSNKLFCSPCSVPPQQWALLQRVEYVGTTDTRASFTVSARVQPAGSSSHTARDASQKFAHVAVAPTWTSSHAPTARNVVSKDASQPACALGHRQYPPKPPPVTRQTPSTHLPPATQDLALPACFTCDICNDRKHTVTCSASGRKTHLTCGNLTRAQAQAMPVWHWEDYLQATLLTGNINDSSVIQETAPEDLAEALADLKWRSRLPQHVPRRLKHHLASELVDLINTAIEQRTAIAWWCLLSHAHVGFQALTRAFSSRDTTSNNNTRTYLTDPGAAAQQTNSNNTPRQIRSKCTDGDIRGALRLGDIRGTLCLLITSDTVVTPTTDVIAELWTKHPPAPATEDLQQQLTSKKNCWSWLSPSLSSSSPLPLCHIWKHPGTGVFWRQPYRQLEEGQRTVTDRHWQRLLPSGL